MSVKKAVQRVAHASLGVHKANPATLCFIYFFSTYLVVLGIEPRASSRLGVGA